MFVHPVWREEEVSPLSLFEAKPVLVSGGEKMHIAAADPNIVLGSWLGLFFIMTFVFLPQNVSLASVAFYFADIKSSSQFVKVNLNSDSALLSAPFSSVSSANTVSALTLHLPGHQ